MSEPFRAIQTSLLYIEQNGNYLMMLRNKKDKTEDCNRDKWVGVGGKFLRNESPEECMLREAKEETGLTVTSWRYRALVTFISDCWETEYMHLFTADRFEGKVTDCDEGELAWVNKQVMYDLPLWEGDKIFLQLLDTESGFFSLKLIYEKDNLVSAVLNGRAIM